jgi:predicted permease
LISRLRGLWNNVFRRNQLDRDLDEELRAYADLVSAEKIKTGMPSDEAYRSTRREMGGTEQIRQAVREIRAGALLDRLAQDIRYGMRTLSRSPGFSLVAVTTLALGIGANTAMFSLLDQIVLRLLPVKEPERLVMVTERGNFYGDSYGPNTLSWPMFEDLRDNNRVFSGMFCRFSTPVTLGHGDHAAQVTGELVSGSYFSILGVNAALGRSITPQDDSVPDSQPVVVLSYSFWQTYFNGDRAIVGRTIAINSHNMTVIGVAQPGFDGVEFGYPAKLFVPIMMKTEITPRSDGLKDRRRRLQWVTAYGRLKPGVTREQAQASLQPLLHSILEMEVRRPEFRGYTAADREQFLRNRIELLSGSENGLRNYMRRPLWMLLALTGAVLLLACANLASLLLARATARAREFAVRLAIGASRVRIARQLLVECLLLSSGGGLAGLALAFVTDRFLARMYLSADAAGQLAVSPIPDARVLLFALGAMFLTAFAFGLLPAIRGSHTEIAPAITERAASGATGSLALRRTMVSVQVTLSLLLLVGAGLFVRTLRNLENQGPGFPTEHLLTFSIDPSLNGYSDQQTEDFFGRLAVNLQTMPGVSSVGMSTMPILKGYAWQNAVQGKDFQGQPKQEQPVLNMIGPDYFAALGIPLLAGRAFTVRDVGPVKYAVVNQAFAREYVPAGNPIGKRFRLANVDQPSDILQREIEIVGLIPDLKYRDLRETPPAQAYFPYYQDTKFRFMNFYLRTEVDARILEDPLRERMRQFDPNVPLVGLQTVNEQIGYSLRTERLVASLSAVFGGLATLLAAIGLYGVLAYAVTRRTREMGIRMALGATRANVVAIVMREAVVIVISGLIAGVPLALALAELIRSQLFAIGPRDPLTLLGAVLVLSIAGGLAGFLPALRASSVNPTTALRQE